VVPMTVDAPTDRRFRWPPDCRSDTGTGLADLLANCATSRALPRILDAWLAQLEKISP